MKLTWKKTTKKLEEETTNKRSHPFPDEDEEEEERNHPTQRRRDVPSASGDAESLQSQGNKLAEDGRFGEALGKWESALALAPEKAVLHEQKAQVLLEIGDAWASLKAAIRATELEPSWAEAWITLARAQLNFGEPDASIKSFDKALEIKPDCEDAKSDRETALQLIERRKQLQSTGVCVTEGRFLVQDKSKI